MSKKSVQNPAAVSGELGNAGDVKAIIDHGGEVNTSDETGDIAIHLTNVSGETRNSDDVDDARSAVELQHEYDAKYVQSDDETTIAESGGSETSEHLYTPSESKELHKYNENHDCLISESDADKMQDVQKISTDSEADDGEDVQDVYEKDEEQGLIQLHLAAERGNTEAVRSLLMSSANVDVLDTKHNTPLHNATINGHIDVVNLLLNKNASVNSRNALGQTSLHLAAEIGHLTIAQLLLDRNADVHITDQLMNTPIHIAAKDGHYELVQLLLKYSEFPLMFSGNTPLHFAAKYGHTDVVQLLLNHDENPEVTNLDGDTPLHLASEHGHFEVVGVLLRNNADANIGNESCKTPLRIAAEMGHAEIAKAAIDHNGEVNAVDRNGNTALHHAANNDRSAVVNVLLNHTTERDARTCSRQAVSQFPPHELELSQHPIKSTVDVDQTSNQFVAEGGNVEITNILSSLSSTVNAVCERQATPHSEYAENLMFNGSNVNACNNAKMTPLHLASQNGHTSIVEILLDNHAIVDVMKQSQETPFYLAAKNGHADISDLLIRRGVCDFVEIPFEYKGKDIETPLLVAVEEGHTEVVEVILKHSRRISEKLTKDGEKLQENTKRGVMPVELLKPDGRRVSAEIVWREINTPLEIKRNSEGDVPLVSAALSNDPKMVLLLRRVDQCMYSETDIAESFFSMIRRIQPEYFTDEALSNATKYRMNFRELAQFLINSSNFNVDHQNGALNTFLHNVMRQIGLDESSSYDCLTEESNRLNLQIQIINDVMQLLLEKGADFNLKNSKEQTPLMIASAIGCDQAIQTLFNWEHKSDIKLNLDARDRYGATALIIAARGNHVSIVRLLLNHKASVNLYDYYGFTALHAAIYAPNRNWFDLHFFCKGLLQRKFDSVDCSEINIRSKPTWKEQTVDPYTVIEQLQSYLECNQETTLLKEEVVNLLLANDEINVNAIDLRGNTPLDLAVKSSKRINSATFEALKNRGAVSKLQEPEDDASLEVARVDERGRNPLHRLVLSRISWYVNQDMAVTQEELDRKRFDLMVQGIVLGPENFRQVVTATDDKGRIPLHYAVMPQSDHGRDEDLDLVRVLLEIGSKVNAADMYGKTPLHYAEEYDQYKLLVQNGADENTADKHGHTPKDLKQLRFLVSWNESIVSNLPIGKKGLYAPIDIVQILNTPYVTELTKQKLFETIRIYSQSPRTQDSSEESIWNLWTEKEPIRLNRCLSQLKPLIHRLIERLVDGIKGKDWRFECQPILVGSADEETKAKISGDFDFNFKLIKFSQLCEAFPHPLGPKGYFELRRKPNEDTKSRTDEMFDCFFNLDHCLLTNEVNSRFKIILKEVVSDPAFWQEEQLFEWNLKEKWKSKYESLHGLCMTIELGMIHPIKFTMGGFIFVDISIDVVACVYVEGWWPEDPLPVGICPAVKTNGCTFVFDGPRFDPSKPRGAHFLCFETFARISFAPLESRIIKESSHLIKTAYIVCKLILFRVLKATYQLKTCLLFCMEALDARIGGRTRNEEKITPKQLAFWVERIMFCFMEFSIHDVYPCYFMPSFKQQTVEMRDHMYHDFVKDIQEKEFGIRPKLRYPAVYDLYLDLCPDDTAVDIPIVPINIKRQITEESFNENHDPKWEQFDREELIRKLFSHGEDNILMNSS